MIRGCFFKVLLLFLLLHFNGNMAQGQSDLSASEVENDTLSDVRGIAALGEKVLDLVTWERNDVVYTIYPSLSVSPRNGFVYGVMPAIKWNSSREGKYNTMAINAEHSTKGMLQLQVEHEWYFHPRWLTSGEAFLNSREDLYWVGDGDEEFYFDRKEVRIEWDFLYNAFPDFWIGAGMLVNNNSFEGHAVDVFKNEQFPGAPGEMIFGVGPRFVFDSRHRTISPQKGFWLQFLPLFSGTFGLGDYNYQRMTFDARKYVSLREEKTSLAFQVVLDYANKDVPFYEQPQLGGKERLRGIGHPLKVTGNAIWMTRVEIRQHLWWRFGGVGFAGIGEAADNFQNLFGDFVSSVGGGLRFRMLPDDPLNVRFDFGVSSMGTTGFFISLKEAF